jgi:predicted MFS family arabinose efflux permease
MPPTQTINRGVTWLLAMSVGAIVANIFYAQPLLAEMARALSAPVTTMGLVAMLTQIGTALGMLIFVPLGDKYNRRSLTCILLLAASFSLMAVATAPTVLRLAAACFGVGAASSAVHVLVPFAAHLAPESQRGRVVGIVLSGLLIGVLTARTVSGFLGSWFGWRAVYVIASIAMLLLSGILRMKLPDVPPLQRISYPQLIRSIGEIVLTYPELRQAALTGAMLFGSFSAFWTTLVFFLAGPPYHYGPSVAGLFGLLGATGAAAAPIVGRFADRRGPRLAVLLGIVIAIAAFVILAAGGRMLPVLIAGVILLDLGVQAAHVANQTLVYSLAPDARSRLNTVYMFSYFVGGALASYAAAVCWARAQWTGVCLLALALLFVALSNHLWSPLRGLQRFAAANSSS